MKKKLKEVVIMLARNQERIETGSGIFYYPRSFFFILKNKKKKKNGR